MKVYRSCTSWRDRAGVQRRSRRRQPALKTPPGNDSTHQRLHSSVSLRLVLTNASSFVRKSTPSSMTMPQRPPGLRCTSMMCCRKRTCVALVRYGEVRLRVAVALLPTEWRIGEDNVELRWCTNEQPAVHLLLRQRVAVPDVRTIDAVKNEVGHTCRTASMCACSKMAKCAALRAWCPDGPQAEALAEDWRGKATALGWS